MHEYTLGLHRSGKGAVPDRLPLPAPASLMLRVGVIYVVNLYEPSCDQPRLEFYYLSFIVRLTIEIPLRNNGVAVLWHSVCHGKGAYFMWPSNSACMALSHPSR